MEEKLDVLIIGAGISGLSAADRLLARDPDLKIKILEASERVGGRTFTLKPFISEEMNEDDTFDLGGQWVSDTQLEIMEYLKEFGIEYYPQYHQGKKVVQVENNHEIRTYSSEIPNLKSYRAIVQLQTLINEAEALCKEVDIRDPYSHPNALELDEMSLATFVRSICDFEGVYNMFNSAVAILLGIDMSRISALSYLAYANSSGGVLKQWLIEDGAGQQYKVLGGTQQISQKILEKIGSHRVQFKCKVASISQQEDSFEITTSDGETFYSSRIISSIPINRFLKIELEPKLEPERLKLFQSYQIGNLAKVVVVYKESFWLKDGYSGEVVSDGGESSTPGCENGPAYIWYDATTKKGTPALVGFLGGKNCDQWFSKSKEERKSAIVKNLVTYFGEKANDPLQYHEKNWVEYEHVEGGPAGFFGPGAMHSFHLLRKPHGKIYFAGTDCAVRWAGYMSGAAQAGHKAAVDVLKELDPRLLTEEDQKLLKEFEVKQVDYRTVKRRNLKSVSLFKPCTVL